MRLTMPQIIMLNHAAWVQNERRDAKIHHAKATGQPRSIEERVYEGEFFNGKPVDQLTSEEYLTYHASGMM